MRGPRFQNKIGRVSDPKAGKPACRAPSTPPSSSVARGGVAVAHSPACRNSASKSSSKYSRIQATFAPAAANPATVSPCSLWNGAMIGKNGWPSTDSRFSRNSAAAVGCGSSTATLRSVSGRSGLTTGPYSKSSNNTSTAPPANDAVSTAWSAYSPRKSRPGWSRR